MCEQWKDSDTHIKWRENVEIYLDWPCAYMHMPQQHKTLAVLEALMKWEDKLLDRNFTVVTDHKGLEYFKTQPNLLLRQTRWWEYLSRFNYNTIHVDGTWNQVADSLSRYYEYDTIEDEYPNSKFVKADEILDPDGDLAPIQQFIEIWNQAIRRSQRLQEKTPTVRLESQMINETFNNIPEEKEISDEDTICWGKKSEVITILGANSNSDKNIAGIIHAKVILTHTRKGKLNTP